MTSLENCVHLLHIFCPAWVGCNQFVNKNSQDLSQRFRTLDILQCCSVCSVFDCLSAFCASPMYVCPTSILSFGSLHYKVCLVHYIFVSVPFSIPIFVHSCTSFLIKALLNRVWAKIGKKSSLTFSPSLRRSRLERAPSRTPSPAATAGTTTITTTITRRCIIILSPRPQTTHPPQSPRCV